MTDNMKLADSAVDLIMDQIGYDRNDAWVRHIVAKTLRAQPTREAVLREAARVAEKRRDERFDEYGTREPDTNACYYSGAEGELYEALDEEDEAIAAAILALLDQPEGEAK